MTKDEGFNINWPVSILFTTTDWYSACFTAGASPTYLSMLVNKIPSYWPYLGWLSRALVMSAVHLGQCEDDTWNGQRGGLRTTLVGFVCGVKTPQPRKDPSPGSITHVWAKEASAVCWTQHCQEKTESKSSRYKQVTAASFTGYLAPPEWFKHTIQKKMSSSGSTRHNADCSLQ